MIAQIRAQRGHFASGWPPQHEIGRQLAMRQDDSDCMNPKPRRFSSASQVGSSNGARQVTPSACSHAPGGPALQGRVGGKNSQQMGRQMGRQRKFVTTKPHASRTLFGGPLDAPPLRKHGQHSTRPSRRAAQIHRDLHRQTRVWLTICAILAECLATPGIEVPADLVCSRSDGREGRQTRKDPTLAALVATPLFTKT